MAVYNVMLQQIGNYLLQYAYAWEIILKLKENANQKMNKVKYNNIIFN